MSKFYYLLRSENMDTIQEVTSRCDVLDPKKHGFRPRDTPIVKNMRHGNRWTPIYIYIYNQYEHD